MQVSTKKLSDTKVQLTIIGSEATLQRAKEGTLRQLARSVKVQGFRQGKAPLNLVEKQADPQVLQTEFLERAVNLLFIEAITQEELQPVAQPQIDIKKFVPFTTLEITAELEVLGEIKLPDYKKIKMAKQPAKVTDKDVDEVLAQLKKREAEKKVVQRPAKNGDQVTIDFVGTDAKTSEPIQGADGTGYPLQLGSNTFIPGFEPELIGAEAGATKNFKLKFPKDYGVKALQSREVSFAVTVHKVEELVAPKIDNTFAAKVGPFKTVAELKADIRKQLAAEQEYQADREFADNLLSKIAQGAKVAIPEVLINDQLDRMEQDEKQNLLYRGQTWEEHLKSEGVTAEEHRQRNRADAELRVKAGLVLTAVAEREKISVTAEEVEVRRQLLKGQYTDPRMQAELDKPEGAREIANRLKSEKTLEKLKSYVLAK